MSWALYNPNTGPDHENPRSYEGPDRDERALKEIVVKQAITQRITGKKSSGLSHEAEALGYFRESGSPHIIKMYRHLYEDIGNGTMRLDKGRVHRMFLEYCPGGDLADWFKKKRDM
jgi:serine/threonine protein kinase